MENSDKIGEKKEVKEALLNIWNLFCVAHQLE